ncbi:MAG: hypothetical protein IPM29_23910 [Planctomycetes bacterium]|nr:hypothetical protein [Planctomycetota bacterium]
MKSTVVECVACGEELELTSDLEGHRVRCEACDAVQRVLAEEGGGLTLLLEEAGRPAPQEEEAATEAQSQWPRRRPLSQRGLGSHAHHGHATRRRAPSGPPPLVIVAGVLDLIGALPAALIGLQLLSSGSTGDDDVARFAMITGGLLVVFGLIYGLIGIGLFTGNSIARIGQYVVSGIALLMGAATLANGAGVTEPIGMTLGKLAVAAFAMFCVSGNRASAWFEKDHGARQAFGRTRLGVR